MVKWQSKLMPPHMMMHSLSCSLKMLFLTVNYFFVLLVYFLPLLFQSLFLSIHFSMHSSFFNFPSSLSSSPPCSDYRLSTDRMINVLAVTIKFLHHLIPIVIYQLRLKHCRDWRMLWQIISVKIKW